jgi:imidazolonepropionase-like amidohydrolase
MAIVFEGVRLIDGLADAARSGVDVVVEGGRIAAIRPTGSAPRPPGATVIDGHGRTLLPGLIDAHAHYTFDPGEGDLAAIAMRPDETILADAARHAERALRAGVTTARGAGSIRGLELVLRDRIAAGAVAGPRIVGAGLAVGSVGGHGHRFGVEAAGPAGVAAAVAALIGEGVDVIKLVASEAAMLTTTGLEPGAIVFGRPELTEAEVAAAVEVAHAGRRRVMAHAQDAGSVERCARGGVDSVEHAWLADEAAIEVLAASGVTLVPTLVVTDVNRTLGGLTPVQRERQDFIEDRHRRSCEAAIRLGVPVVAGTDTGEPGVTADMVAREVRLIAEHGAGPLLAIRAATSTAARLLGLDADGTGSVVVGGRADLLLVEGEPLADLRALERVVAVIQGGRLVSSPAA